VTVRSGHIEVALSEGYPALVQIDGVLRTGWTFEPSTGTLDIPGGVIDDERVVVTVNLFISDRPLDLATSASGGVEYPYLPIISGVPTVSSKSDPQNPFSVFTASGSISVTNDLNRVTKWAKKYRFLGGGATVLRIREGVVETTFTGKIKKFEVNGYSATFSVESMLSALDNEFKHCPYLTYQEDSIYYGNRKRGRAVLGICDSVRLLPYDSNLQLDSEFIPARLSPDGDKWVIDGEDMEYYRLCVGDFIRFPEKGSDGGATEAIATCITSMIEFKSEVPAAPEGEPYILYGYGHPSRPRGWISSSLSSAIGVGNIAVIRTAGVHAVVYVHRNWERIAGTGYDGNVQPRDIRIVSTLDSSFKLRLSLAEQPYNSKEVSSIRITRNVSWGHTPGNYSVTNLVSPYAEETIIDKKGLRTFSVANPSEFAVGDEVFFEGGLIRAQEDFAPVVYSYFYYNEEDGDDIDARGDAGLKIGDKFIFVATVSGVPKLSTPEKEDPYVTLPGYYSPTGWRRPSLVKGPTSVWAVSKSGDNLTHVSLVDTVSMSLTYTLDTTLYIRAIIDTGDFFVVFYRVASWVTYVASLSKTDLSLVSEVATGGWWDESLSITDSGIILLYGVKAVSSPPYFEYFPAIKSFSITSGGVLSAVDSATSTGSTVFAYRGCFFEGRAYVPSRIYMGSIYSVAVSSTGVFSDAKDALITGLNVSSVAMAVNGGVLYALAQTNSPEYFASKMITLADGDIYGSSTDVYGVSAFNVAGGSSNGYFYCEELFNSPYLTAFEPFGMGERFYRNPIGIFEVEQIDPDKGTVKLNSAPAGIVKGMRIMRAMMNAVKTKSPSGVFDVDPAQWDYYYNDNDMWISLYGFGKSVTIREVTLLGGMMCAMKGGFSQAKPGDQILFPGRDSPYSVSQVIDDYTAFSADAATRDIFFAVPVTVTLQILDNNQGKEVYARVNNNLIGGEPTGTIVELIEWLIKDAGLTPDPVSFAAAKGANQTPASLVIPYEFTSDEVPTYADIISRLCESIPASIGYLPSGAISISPLISPLSSTFASQSDCMTDPKLSISSDVFTKVSVTNNQNDEIDQVYEETSIDVTDGLAPLVTKDVVSVCRFNRDAENLAKRLLKTGRPRVVSEFNAVPKLADTFQGLLAYEHSVNPEVPRKSDSNYMVGFVTGVEIDDSMTAAVVVDDFGGFYDDVGWIGANTQVSLDDATNEDYIMNAWIDTKTIM
jgi:hypothetical protein